MKAVLNKNGVVIITPESVAEHVTLNNGVLDFHVENYDDSQDIADAVEDMAVKKGGCFLDGIYQKIKL